MTIGDRIREKRMERRWSQRDLAAKMNYSNHSTIGKIESGKVDIPQSRIVQFAEVLGVTPAYLMGWEQEPEDLADVAANVLLDADLLKMVEQYLRLSESDQYAARLMIASLAEKQKKTDEGVSQEIETVSLLETE